MEENIFSYFPLNIFLGISVQFCIIINKLLCLDILEQISFCAVT